MVLHHVPSREEAMENPLTSSLTKQILELCQDPKNYPDIELAFRVVEKEYHSKKD